MSDPSMVMNFWEILALVAVTLFLVARFAPRAWSAIGVIFRVAVLAGATFAALAGIALLMNNETIFAAPGVAARIRRFLSVNSAATSKTGLGSAICSFDQAAPGQAGMPHGPSRGASGAKPSNGESGASQAPGEQPADYYPELETRGYPGIPRSKLFQMAVATVNGLGGWTILGSEARTGSIDCVYTSRIFGFQDDVRIRVTRKNEIELCSQSKVGEPGSTSMLRFCPGDFGANIGHIKQFYAALQPAVDAFYAKEENRQQGY